MSLKALILASVLVASATTLQAQEEKTTRAAILSAEGWEAELKLGVNIGGAAPYSYASRN